MDLDCQCSSFSVINFQAIALVQVKAKLQRPPEDASEARSFMGLVQCFAKSIPDVASIARPLEDLIKK